MPPGAVSSQTTFELETTADVPDPPAGSCQIDTAFTVSPAGAEFTGTVAVAMDIDWAPLRGGIDVFDPESYPVDIVRLYRLDGAGIWRPVASGGVGYGGTPSAEVSELGTFAAFYDTTTGAPDDVLGRMGVFVQHGFVFSDQCPDWWNGGFGKFSNPERTIYYGDAGGTPRVGPYFLTYDGKSFRHDSSAAGVEPGLPCRFLVPGSETIPALDETVTFFADYLVLTNPASCDVVVSQDEPFTITWEGSGPQLIHLLVLQYGPDKYFHSITGMIPNTGEFVLEPADLEQFVAGAEINISISRTEMWPIRAEGYHPDSSIEQHIRSRIKFTVD